MNGPDSGDSVGDISSLPVMFLVVFMWFGQLSIIRVQI